MAFAAGNLLGPLTIGRLFDTIGRRKMIAGTYLVAGILLVITVQLFKAGALNAVTQTLCWTVVFFFASAGASAGYLTVSEIFPLEVRAKAIAVFFASPSASARSARTCTAAGSATARTPTRCTGATSSAPGP
jgi:MFS family permease